MIGLVAVVTSALLRVGEIHVDGAAAQAAADMTALAAADGVPIEILESVAGWSGATILELRRDSNGTTVLVRRGNATATATAMSASIH